MKFYVLGVRNATLSFVLQCKGLRFLFDPFGVPAMFDLASFDAVFVSSAALAASPGLSSVLSSPELRCPVFCSEAAVVLARASLGSAAAFLARVSRLRAGERVALCRDVWAEARSSGLALGSCCWRLSLFGRVVAVLCESSLHPLRHPLPFDSELLHEAALLVAAVARPALGDFAALRASGHAELRALLAAGPVAAAVSSAAALVELLEAAREMQPPPAPVLLSRDGPALIAATAALAESFDASRLARVHNGDHPLALLPQTVPTPSLPLQSRSQHLYISDDLPALLAAVGNCAVVVTDPVLAPASAGATAFPPSTKFLPLDPGLNAAQLRLLCSRVPLAVQLTSNSPFPVVQKLSSNPVRKCRVVSSELPVAGRVRVQLHEGTVVLGDARRGAPESKDVISALRRAGISLMQLSCNDRSYALLLPTLDNSRIEVDEQQTKVIATTREAFELLTGVLKANY